MKYDGFDLVTGNLTLMHEVSYSWPITLRKIPTPFIDLAKSVEELVRMQDSFPQDGRNCKIRDLGIRLSKISDQVPLSEAPSFNAIVSRMGNLD